MQKFSFYMISPDEEQSQVDFLRQESNVKIVCYRTFTPELDVRDTMPPLGSDFSFRCYLWDVDHSPPPINEYIPTQNHYVIDDFKSEIIQFNRCSIRYEGGGNAVKDGEPWVSHGRIAINHKRWINGELAECPKHFLAFFERARKWIKKNGAPIKEGPHLGIYSVGSHKGFYVFPSVEKFFAEGGKVGPY